MNDFTREELQDIYEVFDMQGACRLLGLKAKIKSMMDNYCEHDKKMEIVYTICCGTQWNHYQGDKGIARCYTCGEILK